jgi:hypothetical protein
MPTSICVGVIAEFLHINWCHSILLPTRDMASIYAHVHGTSRSDMFASACVLRPLLPVYDVLKALCLCTVALRFVEALCITCGDRNTFSALLMFSSQSVTERLYTCGFQRH